MFTIGDRLFQQDRLLSEEMRRHVDSLQAHLDEIHQEQFLATNDDALFEHIFSAMELPQLELHMEAMRMSEDEVEVDVRGDSRRDTRNATGPCMVAGVQFRFSIPVTGPIVLMKLRLDPYQASFPRGLISGSGDYTEGQIDIIYEYPSDTLDPERVRRELDKNIDEIRSKIDFVNAAVTEANTKLESLIPQEIVQRRQRLKRHAEVTEALNIPVMKRPGSPDIKPLPVQKKIVRPLPSTPTHPPEPGILEEDYEAILAVIRHAGRSFENTPETFAVHDEEDLRNIVLSNLNSIYEGKAGGELFRKTGKTDICIEDKDRRAFVAECKVWAGGKELLSGLNQLLGYLTWRDCKTALVVFNKSVAGFKALQQKVPEALMGHPNFERSLKCDQAGEWRFVCRSRSDEDRKVAVHVFLFDLYVEKD